MNLNKSFFKKCLESHAYRVPITKFFRGFRLDIYMLAILQTKPLILLTSELAQSHIDNEWQVHEQDHGFMIPHVLSIP